MDIDIDEALITDPPDPPPVRHKTLSTYYPHLFTLGTHLASVDGLVYHSDTDEYRELVSRTICAPRNSAPVPPFEALSGSQAEAVAWICTHLRGRGDVLLSAPKDRFRSNVSVRHLSGPSTLLLGAPWCILRSRLGDAAFRHLFLNTSIFLPLVNNSYMQLCGPPVYELYEPAKQAKRKAEEGPRKKQNGASAASINLSRQRLYYGRPPRTAQGRIMYGLPKNHILNKHVATSDPASQASVHASMELLLEVFPSMRNTTTAAPTTPWDRVKGNKRRVDAILPVMHKILVRHRKLDYRALLTRCLERLEDVNLDAYPRLPSDDAQENMSWVTSRNQSPIVTDTTVPLQRVSHSQVCRFVVAVLRGLLPVSVLGNEDNFGVVVNRARILVRAKMYEPMSVHSLVQDLHITDFTWLALGDHRRVPPQEATKRRQLVEHLMYWLFEQFLIPLLRASFYATETATTRYETVYYSHDAWARTTEPHLKKLQGELLEELDESQHHLAKGPLGACAVRLIPKPAGFRPIVNLGRTTGSGGRSQKGTSANDVLKGVHQVLTFEKNRKRESLGSCLFGTSEIFAPVRDLKQELLRQHGRVPKLFFVKMDIKSAFDTIQQDKVLQVVERMLDRNYDYCLMLYCLLLPPASKASQASARRLFKTRAVVADHTVADFEQHVQNMAQPLRNAVIVDLFRRQEISREACVNLLRSHIQMNVWQIGDQYYRQKTGIPQGSKISSLLCSFFYSFMEAEHLAWTRRPGTRLLRYIDDFLLITDDYSAARRFVDTMSRGFPEYGAFVSPSKTLLSFELAPGGQAAPVARVVANGSSYFPYCGFLINTGNLNISIDIERLMAGPTRQSFALRSSRRPGSNFVGWLSRQLENRNHAAYLDTDHNDQDTVHMNVFINFAHTALKIPHYFSGTELDDRRSKLVYAWLCLAAEYTYSAGRARVRHAARGCSREHFSLSRKSFLFIALSAVCLALSRRASRFRQVVQLLKQTLEGRENRGVAERLHDVVERGWCVVQRRQ